MHFVYLCRLKTKALDMKKFICLIFLFYIANQCVAQQDFRNPRLPIDERVQLLLDQLTLEEKLGMMEHHNPAVERLGIPAYSWWNEALHGVARDGFATVYPMPTALAATFDDKAVREMFGMVADEARLKFNRNQLAGRYDDYTGVSFFTPNINIFRDPRWGRGMETYGEDPYLTARMGTACVNGLQQQVEGRYKALACIKHFAVHSGPEADRHSFDATVSGGEAQRVKLGTELAKRDTGKTLYVLDEPTTGLHFEDIKVLMNVLNKLVEKGNTVLIIEHNMDVIKMADWIIDMGPEGGERGGRIVCEGTPEELAQCEESYTGKYLREEL